MEQYFENYSSLEQQRWMVSDAPRTDAFAKAIAEVVQPGDLVIDVGCGTGILSLLAAKAGARRVIGIERSDMAPVAKELVEKNGYQGQIEIFHGNSDDLKLDEKADVIVSEWLGHIAYVEGMFRSVMKVRDAHLKPGGKLLPSDCEVLLAPIDDKILYSDYGPGFWDKAQIHGIDFSSLTSKELEMGHSNQLLMPDKYLLAPGQSLGHLETVDARPNDEWSKGTLNFKMSRDGILNGFVGWFSSRLSPNVVLDTAPHCPETHWQQTHFPFHPIPVKEGQTLEVQYKMDEPYEGSRLMEMNIRVGDKKVNFIVD